jgi:cell division protease FtsH
MIFNSKDDEAPSDGDDAEKKSGEQGDAPSGSRFPFPPQLPGVPGRIRPGFFFVLIGVALISYFVFKPGGQPVRPVSYTEFTQYVDRGELSAVKIYSDGEMDGSRRIQNGTETIRTIIPYSDPTLMPALRGKGIVVSGGKREVSFFGLIFEFLPWILTFGFLFFMMRGMQGNPGRQAFQFGKSRARLFQPNDKKKITFADIAGQAEAKNELQEVVAFLKDSAKFTKMGARIPKGVLLVGMPGTGKTLMARAVAGEAGVAFFHMSGSDFVEMFVGVGASRVRDLFEQGRKHAPCILFIDELDAVGRTRGAGYGGGHDEREQTLNQMLVEMDGFDAKDNIIVLAATNRPDVLDPALLRPGRFDRQVTVAMPDVNERAAILKIHANKVKLRANVDIPRMARATPGMSGADLANLVNEAALIAARGDKIYVEMADLEEARDKILMGIARKSLAISEKERHMTAVHESGHALLHYFLPNADPLHKVTIVPHGQALGMAVSLPEEDSYSRTRGWITDRITICYGGFVAEKLFYNETTTGTKQDLRTATDMARKMVCEWGMHDDVGPITFGEDEEPIFLGKEIARHKDYSEETAQKIDAAMKSILNSALRNAENLLESNRALLQKLSDCLFEKETLDDSEVRSLLGFSARTA